MTDHDFAQLRYKRRRLTGHVLVAPDDTQNVMVPLYLVERGRVVEGMTWGEIAASEKVRRAAFRAAMAYRADPESRPVDYFDGDHEAFVVTLPTDFD